MPTPKNDNTITNTPIFQLLLIFEANGSSIDWFIEEIAKVN